MKTTLLILVPLPLVDSCSLLVVDNTTKTVDRSAVLETLVIISTMVRIIGDDSCRHR